MNNEKFYANKVIRAMTKTAAAMHIGAEGFALVALVAIQEDAIRYKKDALYYNEQLMVLLGFKNIDKLQRVRKKVVKEGWLRYVPGGKSKTGSYSAIIPERFEMFKDCIVTEIEAETKDDSDDGDIQTPDKRRTNSRETHQSADRMIDKHPSSNLLPIPNPPPNRAREADSETPIEEIQNAKPKNTGGDDPSDLNLSKGKVLEVMHTEFGVYIDMAKKLSEKPEPWFKGDLAAWHNKILEFGDWLRDKTLHDGKNPKEAGGILVNAIKNNPDLTTDQARVKSSQKELDREERIDADAAKKLEEERVIHEESLVLDTEFYALMAEIPIGNRAAYTAAIVEATIKISTNDFICKQLKRKFENADKNNWIGENRGMFNTWTAALRENFPDRPEQIRQKFMPLSDDSEPVEEPPDEEPEQPQPDDAMAVVDEEEEKPW